MMPLGLTASQLVDYHERLQYPHDFKVALDVLHLDEKPRGKLTATFQDGQVNLQRAPRGVARSATFTIYDPNHALHLDSDSPFEGAIFFDRMVRVRHIVEMPWGDVTAVPFCGPMTRLSREGDLITLECQDKAVLAMEGRPPMVRAKGYNAVKAIRDFMEATGERRFRFNVSDRKRGRRLPRPYKVSWSVSPWTICQRIADEVLNMQLVYSCDGALILRDDPSSAAVVYRHSDLIGGVRIDYDASAVRNYVRVTGQIPAVKKKDNNDDNNRPRKFTETAVAKASHPMSPTRLGRNGEKRFLPLLIEDTAIKKHTTAAQRARTELNKALPMQIAASWSSIPFFHLDTGDRIKVITDDGDFVTPLIQGSLPLGLGGDASVNRQRSVSKPRRTGRRARG